MEAALAALATRELAKRSFDVAYVRISASSSLIPLAIAARGVPLVLELNGRILVEMAELKRPRWVIEAVRLSLRGVIAASRALVAVERRIGAHASEALGAKNVVVIENGADLDAATPGERDAAKHRLGLDLAQKYVAFTGTLVPEQRFDLLLEAHERAGNFSLLIAGDGPQGALIKAAAAKSRAPIVHLGVVPHATAIDALRAAHACINVRDGDLGMKCFEYAAVGRRFVAFEYEGTERLAALYPGLEAVHLVRERSAAGVGAGIEAAIAAEQSRGPLPAEAIADARATIGWDHTARRIAEVLASCA